MKRLAVWREKKPGRGPAAMSHVWMLCAQYVQSYRMCNQGDGKAVDEQRKPQVR